MGLEGAVLVRFLAMIDRLEFHALAEFEIATLWWLIMNLVGHM